MWVLEPWESWQTPDTPVGSARRSWVRGDERVDAVAVFDRRAWGYDGVEPPVCVVCWRCPGEVVALEDEPDAEHAAQSVAEGVAWADGWLVGSGATMSGKE